MQYATLSILRVGTWRNVFGLSQESVFQKKSGKCGSKFISLLQSEHREIQQSQKQSIKTIILFYVL